MPGHQVRSQHLSLIIIPTIASDKCCRSHHALQGVTSRHIINTQEIVFMRCSLNLQLGFCPHPQSSRRCSHKLSLASWILIMSLNILLCQETLCKPCALSFPLGERQNSQNVITQTEVGHFREMMLKPEVLLPRTHR